MSWIRPGRASAVALSVLGLSILGGCDSGSFVPPPTPGLESIGQTTAAPATLTLAMILDPRDTPERVTWVAAARQEAGLARAGLIVDRPKPGEPASAQAALIRKAAGPGGASALIVEPMDDPAVSEALRDARAAGTPVVVLGRKLASRDPAAPFASVAHPPASETAGALVTALMADAKGSGASPGGHALIPLNTGSGPGTEEMAAALAEALKAAGVTKVESAPFKGDYEAAFKALSARLEADREVAFLLAPEDQGLAGALKAYDAVKASRPLGMVGLTTVDRTVNPSFLTNCAAIADRNVSSLSRQAVLLALRLARRESTAGDVVVPQPLYGRNVAQGAVFQQSKPTPPPPSSGTKSAK